MTRFDAEQVAVIRAQVGRGLSPGHIAAKTCEFAAAGCKDVDDALGDTVLHREQIFRGPVVARRPERNTGRGVNKLDCDPNLVPSRLQCALKHVVGVQLASDGSHVVASALVGEHGLARDHRKVGIAGQIDDDVRRQTVGKSGPIFVPA